MTPSKYSFLERGFTSPPKENEWICKVVKELGVSPLSEDKLALYIAWNDPFLMQFIVEHPLP